MSVISSQTGQANTLQQVVRPQTTAQQTVSGDGGVCKAPPSTEVNLSDKSRNAGVDASRSNLTSAVAASKDEQGRQTRFADAFGEGSYVKDPNDKKLRGMLGDVDFPGKANAKDGKMSSDDVKGLQDFLKSKGYDCGTAGSDGKFGKDTLDALNRFKADQGKKDTNVTKGDAGKTGGAKETAAKPADAKTEKAAPKEPGALDDLGKVGDGVGTMLDNAGKRLWNGATSLFRENDGGKDDAAYIAAQTRAAGKVGDGLSSLGGRAVDGISRTWNETTDGVKKSWNEAGDGIKKSWNEAGEAIDYASTTAKKVTTDVAREAVKPVAYE